MTLELLASHETVPRTMGLKMATLWFDVIIYPTLPIVLMLTCVERRERMFGSAVCVALWGGLGGLNGV